MSGKDAPLISVAELWFIPVADCILPESWKQALVGMTLGDAIELAARAHPVSWVIDDLELSNRVHNALWRAEVRTIGEIYVRTREPGWHIEGIGRKAISEINRQLVLYSLPRIKRH